MSYSTLVKGYSINQLQESIKQLFSSMDNLCGKHESQHLSLFCYPCENTICVKCWFSEDHAEHKEQAVPLEEACEHYMQKMKASLTWINGRKEVVDLALKQLQENLSQLSKEQEAIGKLRDESEELITGKANPTTVMQIIKTEQAMEELRLNHQKETKTIRQDRRRDFMSEATVMHFRMTEFGSSLKTQRSCETRLQTPYGCEWNCKIVDQENGLLVYLTLLAGKPSEYSVLFDNHPEKVFKCDLDSPVYIGIFKPEKPDLQELTLTVHIRQTYGDRFEQLQDRISRLERENAEHLEFKTYLANWDKRCVPSSN